MMMMRTSYRLVDADEGDVELPESERSRAAQISPRRRGQRRRAQIRAAAQLALWMTSRDNRFFSRAAVNWAWTHMFGRGLVESLDDVDQPEADGHMPSCSTSWPTYFVDSGFDLQQSVAHAGQHAGLPASRAGTTIPRRPSRSCSPACSPSR